jgi:rod shape-determining protein MreC
MTLELLNNQVPLSVGEQLVSAGDSQNDDRPFVPEVPIGRIIHVAPSSDGVAEMATVQPFVDFTAIDIVAVVVHAPKSIPHDSLLPAKPTPAPTVTVTVPATPGSTPTSGATTSSTP